jgi:hypothetical protein
MKIDVVLTLASPVPNDHKDVGAQQEDEQAANDYWKRQIH